VYVADDEPEAADQTRPDPQNVRSEVSFAFGIALITCYL